MSALRFGDVCASGFARGKRVFIRADLNVPLSPGGEITEDTRIRASLPAIQLALDAGAAVMVTSHLGRPTEGAFKPEDSLAPVAACTVVNRPRLMTHLSLSTLAIGARQLVVHEALEMMASPL